MEELEKLADGTWKWNFIEGKKYPLWASSFGQIFGDDAEGTYIGKINGYHVFVEIKYGKTYCYNTTSEQAIWMGEPDEGPYSPYIQAHSDGEVRDEKIKKFITSKLEEIAKQKQLEFDLDSK